MSGLTVVIGDFGPPFLWDDSAGVFAFAVSPWDYDNAEPATKVLVHVLTHSK